MGASPQPEVPCWIFGTEIADKVGDGGAAAERVDLGEVCWGVAVDLGSRE